MWKWFFGFRAFVDVYNFTPFDLNLQIDPTRPKRYCTGMKYKSEGLKLSFKVFHQVDECNIGTLGYLIQRDNDKDETTDCHVRTYVPGLPLFAYQITDVLDKNGDYWPLECPNWYSADWDNWDHSVNGPISLEPELEKEDLTLDEWADEEEEMAEAESELIEEDEFSL